MDQIHAMDTDFIALTGREAFGYVAEPTPATLRITFQDGSVHTRYSEAYGYMTQLLHLARTDPAKLPYPLDQELTPAQDRRA